MAEKSERRIAFEKKLEELKTIITAYEMIGNRIALSQEQLTDLRQISQLVWLFEEPAKPTTGEKGETIEE